MGDYQGGSTGKWADPDFPKRGWACVQIDDLATEPGWHAQVCEMCEVQEIRYVHTMRHFRLGIELEVGCICADHMEGVSRGKRRENMMRRVATFVKTDRWRLVRGTWHLWLSSNVRVAVIKDKFERGGWVPGVCINGKMVWGARCASLLDAKRALWNRLHPGSLPAKFKLHPTQKEVA